MGEGHAGGLVGRAAELDAIDAVLDALGRGDAERLAVAGEPGIGKTRLLTELRVRAEERGHLVLAGSAAEFEREVPFSVWADVLDAYVLSQQLPLDDGLREELGAVLPSLRAGAGPQAPLADERYRSHRAVSRLLALLAEDRGLVVVLDDLHWSDAASIELLASLVRRPPDAPVLLACGLRPGAASPALTAALPPAQVRTL